MLPVDPTENQINLARVFGCVHAFDADEGLFVLSPDRIGFGVIAEPSAGVDQQSMDALNGLLNLHFPTGTLVQFCLFASPDLEETLHRFQVMRHACDNPLLQEVTAKRVAFLRELTGRPIGSVSGAKLRQTRLMITVSLKQGTKEPTREELLEYRELRNTFRAALKACGFRFTDATPETYIRWMEPLLNHGPRAMWRRSPWPDYDASVLVCNQVLDADTAISVDKKQLALGDHAKVRVLSVKRYPDVLWPGMAMRYLADLMKGGKALRDPLLVTVNVVYPDHESKRADLARDFAWTTRQTDGPLARYIPEWGRRNQSQRIAMEAVEQGDRLVHAYIGMAVFAENEDRVVQASTEVQSMMRELGFQVMEDCYFVLPLFSQLLPFAAEADMRRAMNRYRLLPTRHVVPMLPVLGSWRGTGTPMLTLFARDGNLMCVSPNDTDGNMNIIVAAQSGAGKSFLANETIMNYLSIGGRAWVIDKGFSYKPLAHLMGGTFIEFTQELDICLNMFTLVKNWEEESDIVCSIIEVMAAPNKGFDDFQQAGLKRVVATVWDQLGQEASVRDVAAAFLVESDPRLNDIGHQLFPFSEGEYARYFVGRNNCDLENSLVVLELQQLTGRKHLQRVVLLMLMYQIQSAMDSLPRDLPKLLLVDEAFGLLATNETSSFLVSWYRQLRKFGASAMICTQSVNDLYESDGAKSIVENSAHMWLLAQKAESIAMVKREGRMPMSEGAFRLLESVHTVPGEFSEILVRCAWGLGVGRLVVSEFNKLLYSTKAQDVAAIKGYRDQGATLVEAINAVLRDRGMERAAAVAA